MDLKGKIVLTCVCVCVFVCVCVCVQVSAFRRRQYCARLLLSASSQYCL